MKKNVTIADVAKSANVSVTTVSRYLNGNYKKMSPKTRSTIKETIQKLNYAPKASARKMRTDYSKMVGVIVADISNVFSSLLFKGIYDVLQPAGYDVLLMNSNNSNVEESNEIQRLFSQQVDGLILQPNSKTFEPYEIIQKSDLPMVTVDREIKDLPTSIDKVVSCNFDSSYQLGNYLRDKGYNNIVTVSRTLAEISAQGPRIEAFKQSADVGLMRYDNIETKNMTVSELTKQLSNKIESQSGKTAVISLMGPLLFDLLSIFKKLKVKFPNDIGLVSFDDWNWSQYVNDGVFLLRQQPELIGKIAATQLLDQIEKSGISGSTTYVPVQVVKKSSI